MVMFITGVRLAQPDPAQRSPWVALHPLARWTHRWVCSPTRSAWHLNHRARHPRVGDWCGLWAIGCLRRL